MFACESAYIPFLSIFSTHRRRVSTRASSVSQQQVNGNHWSRRVTANNPHGFADKTIARLRAIEDPTEREKEEKKVLDKRRMTEKHRSNADAVARVREQMKERNRQLKINAGYVMIAVKLKNLSYFHCMLIISPFTATAC
jgi:hypothetical protein